MNNKLNNMVNDFLTNTDTKDEKELNEKLQEFIEKYNKGEIEYNNTPLDDAYELLEKAERAKSKTQALKYAKEAYNMCPDCFDAILFQVHLEDGVKFEKDRLEDEEYFQKDNIGHFYGIFETRPYIRGLNTKAYYLIQDGKIKKARDICKEIILLNENDNTGARYLLMAIYAYLEDEKSMLELYEKYPEKNLEMLFPLFALYYKLEDNDKAKNYLEEINKENPDFIKLFKGAIKENKKIPNGYFHPGDASEVLMYFENYSFLITTMLNMDYFILENTKIKK